MRLLSKGSDSDEPPPVIDADQRSPLPSAPPPARRRYDRPPIVVTESGCDVPDESALAPEAALRDAFRVDYYRGYLAAAAAAKHQDGADLQVPPFLWKGIAINPKNLKPYIHEDSPCAPAAAAKHQDGANLQVPPAPGEGIASTLKSLNPEALP